MKHDGAKIITVHAQLLVLSLTCQSVEDSTSTQEHVYFQNVVAFIIYNSELQAMAIADIASHTLTAITCQPHHYLSTARTITCQPHHYLSTAPFSPRLIFLFVATKETDFTFTILISTKKLDF